MAEITNPDDVMLKKKTTEVTLPKGENIPFVEKKDPIEKFFDWWNNLKIKPFFRIRTGPDAPDQHDVTIGISGTF